MTEQAEKLRISVLKTAYYGKDANLQSVFSSIEILRVLYDRIMNISDLDKKSPNRDWFILSKGQSTMALVALLCEKGFLSEKELETACKYDSRISMQADRTKLSAIENSAGSLGHGFPMAVGVALANKIKNYSGKVYTLVGDGEMNEGTMWEAVIFAASEKLDNLTVIVDDNGSINEMIDIGNLSDKFKVFGFETVCVDGHDEDALEKALSIKHVGKPLAVIAKTQRGYGCKTIMTDRSWFHRAPDLEELNALIQDVENFE